MLYVQNEWNQAGTCRVTLHNWELHKDMKFLRECGLFAWQQENKPGQTFQGDLLFCKHFFNTRVPTIAMWSYSPCFPHVEDVQKKKSHYSVKLTHHFCDEKCFLLLCLNTQSRSLLWCHKGHWVISQVSGPQPGVDSTHWLRLVFAAPLQTCTALVPAVSWNSKKHFGRQLSTEG